MHASRSMVTLVRRAGAKFTLRNRNHHNQLGLTDLVTCVYRKLDSAILVVKATENWVGRDGTEALNRAMERRVLVQGTMDPRRIIVGGICAKNPAQVRFTEYDHMVRAL